MAEPIADFPDLVEDDNEYGYGMGIEPEAVVYTPEIVVDAPPPVIVIPQFDPFGENTTQAIYEAYFQDGQQLDQRYRTGYPLFDRCIATLVSGIVTIGGEENSGKTNLATNLYMGILRNTPNARIIDFVLDDSRVDRTRCLVAQIGELSIREVALPRQIPETDPRIERRRLAYGQLMQETQGRLAMLDSSCLNNEASFIKTICSYVESVRQQYPNDPIWVNIDAFDDISVEKEMTENEQVKHIVRELTKCHIKNDVVFCVTKHLVKGSGRGAGMDSLSGPRSLKYATKLGIIGYNDVSTNGQSAEIYYERTDQPEGHKAPIFEVSVKKNKVGDFKGLIAFFQIPEKYLCVEVPEDEQEDYRLRIREQMGAQRGRERRD